MFIIIVPIRIAHFLGIRYARSLDKPNTFPASLPTISYLLYVFHRDGYEGSLCTKKIVGTGSKITNPYDLSSFVQHFQLTCTFLLVNPLELVLWVHWEVAQFRVQAGGNGNLFGRSLADQWEWHKMAVAQDMAVALSKPCTPGEHQNSW